MILENKETEFVEYVTCENCENIFEKLDGLTYQVMIVFEKGRIGYQTHNACSPKCFINEMNHYNIYYEDTLRFSGMSREFINKFLEYFKFDDDDKLLKPDNK